MIAAFSIICAFKTLIYFLAQIITKCVWFNFYWFLLLIKQIFPWFLKINVNFHRVCNYKVNLLLSDKYLIILLCWFQSKNASFAVEICSWQYSSDSPIPWATEGRQIRKMEGRYTIVTVSLGSSDPFYIVSYYDNMCHYLLDTQYNL